MNKDIRWGIISAGVIAHKFAANLQKLKDARVAAVAASSLERAESFAGRHGIPKAYGSYREMCQDPDIDAVYISTIHTLHRENALLCLEHGKPVLCEKPFALNAAQAREMVQKAREKKLFLMEAMWTRFMPAFQKAMGWIRSGRIGEVRMLKADFGFRAAWKPELRLLNPEQAGGALLDVGVYPVSLASHIFGSQPSDISAQAHIGSTHVDEQTAMVFKYPDGRLALLSGAIRTRTPQQAFIMGTEGMIWMPGFWRGRLAVMFRGRRKLPAIALGPSGFQYEAAEAGKCISQGLTESPLMPLDETIAIMETMDRVREEIGLRYPGEGDSPPIS